MLCRFINLAQAMSIFLDRDQCAKSLSPWDWRFCPEIADYAASGISNRPELMATAAQVRGYLDISPSAYEDALDVFGQENTAVVIACILQRAQNINSAGGYLRALTEKARAREFTFGPILMATLQEMASIRSW